MNAACELPRLDTWGGRCQTSIIQFLSSRTLGPASSKQSGGSNRVNKFACCRHATNLDSSGGGEEGVCVCVLGGGGNKGFSYFSLLLLWL